MRISQPEIVREADQVVVRVAVAMADGTRTLWYALEARHAELVSDRADAPLLALLIPAMAHGEDIEIEGAVSEKLYFQLAHGLQSVLNINNPALTPISIHPAHVEPAPASAGGVATGFSAGIDSFCVLADHHYGQPPAGYRLTHLLFNNVGSHGKGGEALFHARRERAAILAERIGLPLVTVNSNLDDFYRGFAGWAFDRTHTPRNVSVALLLQKGLGRFLYASAYHYGDVSVQPQTSIALADPVTLPLMSTEALDALVHGSDYTRVEKTLRVAEVPDSYKALNVCVDGEVSGNCSRCWKCLRTQLTLEISGALDRYASVFDLAAYRAHREDYIADLLRHRGPLQEEIVAFAEQRGFRFPVRARLRSRPRISAAARAVRSMLTLPWRAGRAIKRALLSPA